MMIGIIFSIIMELLVWLVLLSSVVLGSYLHSPHALTYTTLIGENLLRRWRWLYLTSQVAVLKIRSPEAFGIEASFMDSGIWKSR